MSSTSGRFLLGLMLGVVLGGGAAYLLGGLLTMPSTRAAELEALTMPTASSVQVAPTPIEKLPDLAPREEVHTTGKAVNRAVDVPDGKVESLLASLDAPAVEPVRGEGAISGKVTDKEGGGVADVVLRAQRRPDSIGGTSPGDVATGAPELKSLEETVRDAVKRYSESRSNLFETRTDATGAYRFEGLPDGAWQVSAYKKDLVVSALSDAYQVRPGDELDFRAVPVLTVPVSVYLPSGQLAKEAFIGCNTNDRSTSGRYKWNASEAALRLGPGAYEITAYSADSIGGRMNRGDDSEQKSESQRVVLEAGETPAPLRFELAGRLGIRGYVRFPSDGIEGSSPQVHILAIAPTEEPDLEALAETRESTWVRAGSEYSFLDLDAGRYVVGVSRSWSSPIDAHAVVEVTDGIARCDLELPPVDRSKLLHVAVLGADGGPVIGVDFSLRVESERGSWGGGGVQEMTDSDGSYLLNLGTEHQADYFGGGGDKTFTLTANHEDFGSKSEKLQPGQLELTIVLAPPGKLEVTIAGYQGSGFEGRMNVSTHRIGAEDEGGFWFGSGRNRMSSTGVQKFEGLAPGRYALRLWLEPEEDRGWGGGREIDRIEISVAAGDNFATMTIPALYSFDVIYLDGKEGTTFGLSRIGQDEEFYWGGFNADLDSTGKARFADVPAGDYTLSCWGGRMQKMEIRVPCKNIEFVPMLLNALLVKIEDENGDMAKLGFRTGDLIVGIDGREFDREPDMSLFSPLFASKSAKLTFLVQRGGESLEIEVTGSQIGDWGTLGGEVEPTAR